MGKIIFSIIMLIVIALCLALAFRENIVNGTNKNLRAFYGIMICLGSVLFGVMFVGLIFNL